MTSNQGSFAGVRTGELALERNEERALGRRAPEQDEPVVRDADEWGRQHAHERLVVVAVVQQPQVVEEVDHLLLVVVVTAGRAEGRQPERAQGSGAEPDSAWDFVVVVDDPGLALLPERVAVIGGPIRPTWAGRRPARAP